MKITLTVVIISALLYAVGYQMVEDESDKYDQHIRNKLNTSYVSLPVHGVGNV
jgi:hypothetical protein